MTTIETETRGLTPEEISALNQQAVKVDSIIVIIVFFVSLFLGGLYIANYDAPPSQIIRSAETLQAQDFIADYTFLGAEISQDEPGDEIVASRNGEIIGTFMPFENSTITLEVNEGSVSKPYQLSYSD